MPYSTWQQAPEWVRKRGEAAAQRWVAAFNAALKQYRDETRAFRVTNAAVTKRAQKGSKEMAAPQGRRTFKLYSPDQPRAPKGDPEGGQWVPAGHHEGPAVSAQEAEKIARRQADMAEAVMANFPEEVRNAKYSYHAIRAAAERGRRDREKAKSFGDLSGWLRHKEDAAMQALSVLGRSAEAHGPTQGEVFREQAALVNSYMSGARGSRLRVAGRSVGTPKKKKLGAYPGRTFKLYSPDQPRAPKGDPEGGQWVPEGDAGDAGATSADPTEGGKGYGETLGDKHLNLSSLQKFMAKAHDAEQRFLDAWSKSDGGEIKDDELASEIGKAAEAIDRAFKPGDVPWFSAYVEQAISSLEEAADDPSPDNLHGAERDLNAMLRKADRFKAKIEQWNPPRRPAPGGSLSATAGDDLLYYLGEMGDGAAGADGKTRVRAPILRTGRWKYKGRDLNVTLADLERAAQNFTEYRKDGVCLDYVHGTAKTTLPVDQQKAAGWLLSLDVERYADKEGGVLWGTFDLSPKAAEYVRNKEFRYCSAEFDLDYEHPELDGKAIGTYLLAVALTNRPFVERLGDMVFLSDDAAGAVYVHEKAAGAKAPTIRHDEGSRNGRNKERGMRVKLHEFGRPDLEVDEEVRQFFAEQLAARDDALAAEEDAHRATSAKLSEASATTAKLTERVANVEKEAKEVRRKARFAELQDPRRGAKMLKAEEEAMTQLFNENEALFDSIMKARPTLAAMSGTPAGGTLPGGAADTAQARFDAAVEAVKRERRITFSEAFDAVCKEQPSLHAEYKAERDRDRGPMPGSNYVPAGEVV